MDGRSFRFFISSPQPAKRDAKEKIYGYSQVDNAPSNGAMPEVRLFGKMTQNYCKSLAVIIYMLTNVRMRIPSDYEHPGFHADEITMSFVELTSHLRDFIGDFKELPAGAIVSMSLFFDYLQKVLSRGKKCKNLFTHD